MSKQLQFAPFSSALDAGFWHKLSQLKLDVYGLDDQPRHVKGFYFNGDPPGLPCRMNMDYTAFEEIAKTPPHCFPSQGILKNTNTMEDFKSCDKKALLEREAFHLWQDIVSGKAIEEPALLAKFLVLTFADLKKYHYYYWFAFPAVLVPEVTLFLNEVQTFDARFNQKQIESFLLGYDKICLPNHIGFFLAAQNGDIIEVAQLKEFEAFSKGQKVMLCVCDPCTLSTNPGWPLRNLITLAAYHWGTFLSEVEIVCFRDRTKDGKRDVRHSIVFTVKFNSISATTECPRCVGWEKNERQKLGPRMVNLSSSMDPVKLAESAVDLNLKLMRWRLLPALDLEKVAQTKCLLLGTGTLGCNVARGLLAWGVRNITLVDNGKISYSNPVRQSLFVFDDSKNGGKYKAQTAAEALKLIFPGVNAKGITISIPMPGHPITENIIEQTHEDVKKLEELIESHDVVFLLMDTRESRWLPTLLGASKQKIVINAALGFDTFLVVRHGVKKQEMLPQDGATAMEPEPPIPFNSPIPGHMLGCYFCNDVVAPGDSTRDRTLDQQCTVSRPGMSMIVSALAVELLVSILQHPLGGQAQADTSVRDEYLTKNTDSPLGLVPHQIRGFLSRYQQVMPASSAYSLCTACSQTVIHKYQEDGFNFLLNAFNQPKYLEDLTGLTRLHAETVDAEVWELSDSEEEM